MTRTDFRSAFRPRPQSRIGLGLALAISLLLHVAPLLDRPPAASPHAPTPPLRASLQAPEAPPLPAPPELKLPDKASPPPTRPAPARKLAAPAAASAAPDWQETVRRQFRQQQREGAFYPAEAIARGLEGEALVLMVLAEDGQVAAARIEQSSGQLLLDEAALRAVRALRGLPAEAPRQALLPVRFRLR